MAGDIHISDPMAMADTVGEIERRFGVRLIPQRVAVCRSVGDLYTHVLEMLGPDGTGPIWVGAGGVDRVDRDAAAGSGRGVVVAIGAGAARTTAPARPRGPPDTPTLMALWRLRQGLCRLYPRAEIQADTVLDALDPDLRRPAGLARLGDLAGMEMPAARLHPAWGMALAVPGLGLAWYLGTGPGIILGGLIALLGLVFGDMVADRLLADRLARLPPAIRTVEDLARTVGLLNIGSLRREGGRIPERFLWAAYVDCLRTGLRVDGDVAADQRFILP
ncbi:MAG: hypothetical protein RLY86_324 [Pseudomonadota bacterium]|jgi:hypothetical protein